MALLQPDFSAADLAAALNGKRTRRGWRAACPCHDDGTPSLDIEDGDNGRPILHCHAGCSQAALIDYLRKRGLWRAPPPPKTEMRKDRPPATPDFLRGFGRPDHRYEYRAADGIVVGYVCRWDATAERAKTIRPCTLTPAGWVWQAFPVPRPLYRLGSLLDRPQAQVVLVEGEKCADAVATILEPLGVVSTTWPGGSNAIEQADWSPLAGRRVVAWPDNDPAGDKAMTAIAAKCGAAQFRIVEPPKDRPKGWDLADAVSEGWDARRIVEFAKAHERKVTEPRSTNVAPIRPGAAIPTDDPIHGWRQNLITGEDYKPKPKLAWNWKVTLAGHGDTRDLFAWNEAQQQVFVMRRPPWDDGVLGGPLAPGTWIPRALTDADQFETAAWLEQQSLTPKKNDARETIKVVARMNRYNPVQDYLLGLKWDGMPRLAGGASGEGDTIAPLAVEYLDAPSADIFATFATKWHIAAVARALRPGCKVDTMLVFESAQGKRKSSYLRLMSTIDGHAYFGDAIGDITSAGSIMLLQGTWLVEAAELAVFDRREREHIKAWLSRETDRYVPKFESEPKEVPRHYVVAGTHNPSGHGYLRDPTGARRFWPLPVGEIDLDRAERDRDQIWAEAVARFKAGEQWWLTPEEELQALVLTEDRQEVEAWGDRIDEVLVGVNSVTEGRVLELIGVPIAQRNSLSVKRVAEHLARIGWRRENRVWVRPGSVDRYDDL